MLIEPMESETLPLVRPCFPLWILCFAGSESEGWSMVSVDVQEEEKGATRQRPIETRS